jgi:hypothetical protein
VGGHVAAPPSEHYAVVTYSADSATKTTASHDLIPVLAPHGATPVPTAESPTTRVHLRSGCISPTITAFAPLSSVASPTLHQLGAGSPKESS